jgi:hypothetical protein
LWNFLFVFLFMLFQCVYLCLFILNFFLLHMFYMLVISNCLLFVVCKVYFSYIIFCTLHVFCMMERRKEN